MAVKSLSFFKKATAPLEYSCWVSSEWKPVVRKDSMDKVPDVLIPLTLHARLLSPDEYTSSFYIGYSYTSEEYHELSLFYREDPKQELITEDGKRISHIYVMKERIDVLSKVLSEIRIKKTL